MRYSHEFCVDHSGRAYIDRFKSENSSSVIFFSLFFKRTCFAEVIFYCGRGDIFPGKNEHFYGFYNNIIWLGIKKYLFWVSIFIWSYGPYGSP